MFAAPPDQALDWRDDAVAGGHRFLKRWWYLVQKNRETLAPVQSCLDGNDWQGAITDTAARDLRRTTHTLLSRAQNDYERMQYNTVVASMMELLNALEKIDATANEDCALALREGLLIMNKVLAPVTPHIAHRLWRDLGEAGDVIDAAWPVVDEAALVSDTITLAVQVNGKLRSQIEVSADSDRAAVEAAAQADEKVRNHTEGKTVRKVIVVPGRLVNIVVQ